MGTNRLVSQCSGRRILGTSTQWHVASKRQYQTKITSSKYNKLYSDFSLHERLAAALRGHTAEDVAHIAHIFGRVHQEHEVGSELG